MEDTEANTPQSSNENRLFMGVPPLLLSSRSPNRQYENFQRMEDIPSIPPPQILIPPYERQSDIATPVEPQVISIEPQASVRPKQDEVTIVVESPVTNGKQSFDTQAHQGETTHNSQDNDAASVATKIPEDSKLGEVRMFATETLPRLVYLHLLLRLPYLYFSRVEKIFSDARLSMPQIKQMAIQIGATGEDPPTTKKAVEVPRVYLRLQARWEDLIDALMEEWKTLNLIGVLLLGAIMTMFQIDGAAQDPVTRYVAFCSLICSLISLLHGCMFIVRFSTMRKVSRAAEWALEAQRHPNPFWNVWVMLSMPLLWLTWSIVTFVICIMTFMWRSHAQLPDGFVFRVAPSTEPGARIFISIVLGVGMVYTVLILSTLSRYGSQMDIAWRERIDKYISDHTEPSSRIAKTQWRVPQSRAAGQPTKISPEPEEVSEERKPDVRREISSESRREERKREVVDSDRRRRSSESRIQDYRQQDTLRERRRPDRRRDDPRELLEGTKPQVERRDDQEPQGFKFVAKAQGEAMERERGGSTRSVDQRRGPDLRENGQTGVSEAGRHQGVHFRVKEQLEVVEGRKHSRRRSSEHRARSPRSVLEQIKSSSRQ